MADYVIGFDIGTTLGFCVMQKNAGGATVVDSGVLVAKEKHKGARLNSMLRQVYDLLAKYHAHGSNTITIAVEEVAFTKFRLAYASYCQMRAMVELALFQLCKGLPVEVVHTSTLKKHATGGGKASKEEMLAAAEKRYDFDKVKGKAAFDQADAIWVADWLLNLQLAKKELTNAKTTNPTTSKPKSLRLRANNRP